MKKIAGVLMVAAAAVPSLSYAWGPGAIESISVAALQAVRRSYGDALAGNERAVVAGSQLPAEVIMDHHVRTGSVADPVAAVGREINVLRDVARLQFTEYAAFRFGVLGRITAEIMTPFGFPKDDMERALKATLDDDIETMLHRLRYQYEKRRTVHSPSIYFEERTRFLENGRRYIAADYERGVGYGGYARRSVPGYYNGAVSAVADVWFTILRDVQTTQTSKRKFVPLPSEPTKLYSSKGLLVDYFVDEVVYFIEKSDPKLIEESYHFFSQFNQKPSSEKPYERLGDAFLAAGNGPRAVAEYRKGWRLAPEWTELRDKIVRYYLTVGQKHLDSRKRGDYDPLKEALATYEALLEVDPASQLGNTKRQETEERIEARERRHQRAIELLNVGRTVVLEAQELEHEGKLAEAITLYKNAIAMFNSVTEEFEDERGEAESGASDAETSIENVFSAAVASGEQLIASAQQRELEGNWQGAIREYDAVPEALSLFRNEKFKDEYAQYYADAATAMQTAKTKRQAAQTAFEQQQAAQQQQQ